MSDPLRPYWDFDDLDATERRFRDLRAEALTQLARVQGLREEFDPGQLGHSLVRDEQGHRVWPRRQLRQRFQPGGR